MLRASLITNPYHFDEKPQPLTKTSGRDEIRGSSIRNDQPYLLFARSQLSGTDNGSQTAVISIDMRTMSMKKLSEIVGGGRSPIDANKARYVTS
jgi:hypothetical protein